MTIEVRLIGPTLADIGALATSLSAPKSAPAPVVTRPRPQEQRDYYRMLPLATLREVRPTTELEHALLSALDEALDLEEEVEDLRTAADERDDLKGELGEQEAKTATLQAELDAAHDTIAELEGELVDLRHQLSQQETSK